MLLTYQATILQKDSWRSMEDRKRSTRSSPENVQVSISEYSNFQLLILIIIFQTNHIQSSIRSQAWTYPRSSAFQCQDQEIQVQTGPNSRWANPPTHRPLSLHILHIQLTYYYFYIPIDLIEDQTRLGLQQRAPSLKSKTQQHPLSQVRHVNHIIIISYTLYH